MGRPGECSGPGGLRLALVLSSLLLAPVLGTESPARRSLADTAAADAYAIRVWSSAQSNGTSPGSKFRTPPLGWNNYNAFHYGIDETIFKQTVDALVSKGFAAAGYEYVNLDDSWSLPKRDAKGHLVADPKKYPNGIRGLSAYAHQRGLKVGIYSDAGYYTCARSPGSLGWEYRDAKTFAHWGVSYLKLDNCFNDGSPARTRYAKMRQALDKAAQFSGRDIYFNVCEWGWTDPATWARGIGDSWRTTEDIRDSWNSMYRTALKNNQYASYAGPGGFNDPDMLEVGNGGMSFEEYRVQFTLWALMKAPLILGSDVRKLDKRTVAMLTNRDVIAIDQDPLGIQGRLVNRTANTDVWAGPLSGGRVAVALVNKGLGQKRRISADWRMLRLPQSGRYDVKLVWQRKFKPNQWVGEVAMWVAPHSVGLLVLTPSA